MKNYLFDLFIIYQYIRLEPLKLQAKIEKFRRFFKERFEKNRKKSRQNEASKSSEIHSVQTQAIMKQVNII